MVDLEIYPQKIIRPEISELASQLLAEDKSLDQVISEFLSEIDSFYGDLYWKYSDYLPAWSNNLFTGKSLCLHQAYYADQQIRRSNIEGLVFRPRIASIMNILGWKSHYVNALIHESDRNVLFIDTNAFIPDGRCAIFTFGELKRHYGVDPQIITYYDFPFNALRQREA